MDTTTVILLSGFINRLTETLKRAFLNDLPISDDRKGALILLLSLVLGALGVVFLFPSTNLIPGLGASLLAEQIVTGVIIGGLANGIDFLAGLGSAALGRVSGDSASRVNVTVNPPELGGNSNTVWAGSNTTGIKVN